MGKPPVISCFRYIAVVKNNPSSATQMNADINDATITTKSKNTKSSKRKGGGKDKKNSSKKGNKSSPEPHASGKATLIDRPINLDQDSLAPIKEVLESQPEILRNRLAKLILDRMKNNGDIFQREGNLLNLVNNPDQFPKNASFKSELRIAPIVLKEEKSKANTAKYKEILTKARSDLKQVTIDQMKFTLEHCRSKYGEHFIDDLVYTASYFYQYEKEKQSMNNGATLPDLFFGAIAIWLVLLSLNDNDSFFTVVLAKAERQALLKHIENVYLRNQDGTARLSQKSLNDLHMHSSAKQSSKQAHSETSEQVQKQNQTTNNFFYDLSPSEEQTLFEMAEQALAASRQPTNTPLPPSTFGQPQQGNKTDQTTTTMASETHPIEKKLTKDQESITIGVSQLLREICAHITELFKARAAKKQDIKARRAVTTSMKKAEAIDLGNEVEKALSEELPVSHSTLSQLVDQQINQRLKTLQKKAETKQSKKSKQTATKPTQKNSKGEDSGIKRKQQAIKNVKNSVEQPLSSPHKKPKRVHRNNPNAYQEFSDQVTLAETNGYAPHPYVNSTWTPTTHWPPVPYTPTPVQFPYHSNLQPPYPTPLIGRGRGIFSTLPHRGRGRGGRGRGRGRSSGNHNNAGGRGRGASNNAGGNGTQQN